MRPIVVLAVLGQPCNDLFVSIDPEILGDGVTEADVTCDDVVFPHTDPPDVTCDATDVAFVGTTAHASLQGAIDDASDGDSVHVCPGTHTVAARIVGRTLHIASLSADPTDTTLEASGNRTLVVEGSTVALQNLTLSGRGASAVGAELQLDGMRFEGNRHERGAALRATDTTAFILESTFVDNEASGAPGSDGNGGALDLYEGCFEIRDSVFDANHAAYSGGAISVSTQTADTSLGVWDTVFEGNQAGYEAGGIEVGGREYVAVAVWDATFRDNHAGYGGGAITASGWDVIELSVFDAIFDGNTADYEGGAISTGGHGQVYLTVNDTDFTGNESGYDGGAIGHSAWVADGIHVQDSTFTSNNSPIGAAISV